MQEYWFEGKIELIRYKNPVTKDVEITYFPGWDKKSKHPRYDAAAREEEGYGRLRETFTLDKIKKLLAASGSEAWIGWIDATLSEGDWLNPNMSGGYPKRPK